MAALPHWRATAHSNIILKSVFLKILNVTTWSKSGNICNQCSYKACPNEMPVAVTLHNGIVRQGAHLQLLLLYGYTYRNAIINAFHLNMEM